MMHTHACLCLALLLVALSAAGADDRIQPYAKNPRYWQFKDKPVLLLGGTDDDNLFQWTGKRLTDQLDLLKSVGGNYVRCTLSCRDRGNVWPFAKRGDKYDLDQWNPEFWRRFERFLAETARRDIIVQIEVWAFHDFFRAAWRANPWRPANAASYGTANTTLKDRYGNIGPPPHGFFSTVPKLKNDSVVLGYQRKFVDRMLSCTLRYGHVLYCMTNEIPPLYSPEWGWYWCDYIKGKAAAAGKQVETTEMYWPPHLTMKQHHASLDPPGVFTYFEASQNSAVLDGQTNWNNLQFVWNYLARNPRPINHVKIYGADGSPWEKVTGRHATECFWRDLIGGSASSRFHRPPHGLGLSKSAQAQIKSVRMLAESMGFFASAPHNELLSGRKPNEAYCLANPGEEYAVYFPNGGEVTLDIRSLEKPAKVRWLDIAGSRWREAGDGWFVGKWLTCDGKTYRITSVRSDGRENIYCSGFLVDVEPEGGHMQIKPGDTCLIRAARPGDQLLLTHRTFVGRGAPNRYLVRTTATKLTLTLPAPAGQKSIRYKDRTGAARVVAGQQVQTPQGATALMIQLDAAQLKAGRTTLEVGE